MEEKGSNLEKIFDNLYYRAEGAGTIKFDKEDDRQASKTELMNLYKEYFALLSSRKSALEKSEAMINQGDSREDKKHAKQKRKEGKKELKEVNKQIEMLKQQIDSKTDIFDLPQIGGKREAEMMIQRAYNEDRDEEARKAKMQRRADNLASVSPQVKIDERQAFEIAQNAAGERPPLQNEKGE